VKLTVPDMSLVVLVGASGSGKSTFARTHFAPTQVLSSDFFRGLVADDETTSRRRPRRSTRCTTSRRSGSRPAGRPSSTRRTSSARRGRAW
jgi:ABC-type glutathione transport system ATPase component